MAHWNVILVTFLGTQVWGASIDGMSRCWSDGNGASTAKWWTAGSRIVRGDYVYVCENGGLRPVACITPSKRQVRIGDTYDEDNLEMRCTRSAYDDHLFFEPTRCIDKSGRKRSPREVWEQDSSWYTCEQETLHNRKHLKIKEGGCAVNGRRLRLDDTVEKAGPSFNPDMQDDGYYECKRTYKGAALKLAGCLTESRRRVKLGTEFEDAEYGYLCTSRNDKPTIQTTSCIDVSGEHLNSGDRYFKDGSVYMCEILYDPTTSKVVRSHRMSGCVVNDQWGLPKGTKTLGCQWYTEGPKCKFEYRCKEETGKVENVGCTLTKDGFGYLFVPAGSYTIHYFRDKQAEKGVACRVDNTGKLSYSEFEPDEIATKAFGLKYAVPRG